MGSSIPTGGGSYFALIVHGIFMELALASSGEEELKKFVQLRFLYGFLKVFLIRHSSFD